MTNFRVTRIKPVFINREVLAEVAADALAKLNPDSATESDGQMLSEKLLRQSNRIRKWLTIFAPLRLKSSAQKALVTQLTAFASVKHITAVIPVIIARLLD
jgi:hypothetical protein